MDALGLQSQEGRVLERRAHLVELIDGLLVKCGDRQALQNNTVIAEGRSWAAEVRA